MRNEWAKRVRKTAVSEKTFASVPLFLPIFRRLSNQPNFGRCYCATATVSFGVSNLKSHTITAPFFSTTPLPIILSERENEKEEEKNFI